MTPSELARHKQKLLELQKSLLDEGDLKIEPTRQDPTAVGGDEDEQPLAEMSQVIASKRNQERTAILGKIRRALQRLADDPELFGSCSECEEPLGKRLEAMPYAELCRECQSNRDKPRGQARRHLLDFK